jgi:hypothetical protein
MKKVPTLVVKVMVMAVLMGAVIVSAGWTEGNRRNPKAYHDHREMVGGARGDISFPLPFGNDTYFKPSGNCEGCHGHDPSGYAMTTQDGVDVNVVDAWRSTIMANAARDPFWRAKVSHETLVDPGHQAELEDKCTKCHAPMGNFGNHFTTHDPYSIALMAQDHVALDGVSCVPCHIQLADSIGKFFSGELRFDTLGRPLFGPYADNTIFGAPMESFVGYTPQYGEQVLDAGLCAGCHTLITETADLTGDPTGDEFVEQATYHEWLNSDFNDEQHPETGITCQGCHVPLLDDDIGVVLSANYIFLQPKTPFGQHHFAGANTFMLNMLKGHVDTLQLTATPTQFDSTIARTGRMLRQHTLLIGTSMAARDADTAFIDVKLTNLAGHKFPSGYPTRRAWIQLVVINAAGDTLYNNGASDGNFEIVGQDATWEPHHDVVTSPDQVQIYEMVMGDVNGDTTTVLGRAKAPLKDDRLVPAGFSMAHFAYDTTQIVGVPGSDIDFNRDEDGIEGSGTDVVHYHVPVNGETGALEIHATVWYQSVPPRSVNEMFSHSSPEIDLFKGMFQAADNSPVLVRTDSLSDLSSGIDDLHELGLRVFPDPVRDGLLKITGIDARVLSIALYDVNGRKLAERTGNADRWTMRLPGAGTYVVVVHTAERNFVERVVSL